MSNIQLFEQYQVRSHWDSEQEKWYFSIVDVVGVLTDSVNPTDYLKKIRKRDEELNAYLGTNCPQVAMETTSGVKRKTLAGTAEHILRLIQSIPSKKAEPFKIWLAQVGSERLDQIQDPELGIQQALQDYRNLGYSDDWINQRLKSIEIRKELTDEWQRVGVQDQQFAILTNIISKTWSGRTVKEYKQYKGLKKENLRDNMTSTELILNMLAEASAKDISQAVNPETFKQSQEVAKQGGNVAKVAREELEKQTGRSVVSSENAQTLRALSKKEDKN
ncbi:BRO family protein [Moraxella sp. FZFQ2102]|uniref:BRO family protein n=1 Tax=Moraxella sp. FZFQ2102 TaxID=2953752 RepID=UPI00209C4026|nr:BRO family protein [Moraxella sp. FZFQ2102]USZ15593.1 BRO family protein [Moraxella sp. FZFQ2102]